MYYNYVYKFSGGEKCWLKLMMVLMVNFNFFIFDELMNDLDIFVMLVLEDYLCIFQGCFIVVLYDCYFMDKMVDYLFVFQGDGKVKDIIGNYIDFCKQEFVMVSQLVFVFKLEVVKIECLKVEQLKRKLSFKEKQEFDQLEKDLENWEEEKIRFIGIFFLGIVFNQEIMEVG